MKLKQQPEDFQVEELTNVHPNARGDFSFYRLEKHGIGTPEAVQAICRRWKIEWRRVSYGGLKDRHALTSQYLTIFRGPRRGLKQNQLKLEYLGPLSAPYAAEHIRANRFRIVIRDMSRAKLDESRAALDEVRTDGVANYFDDQRFGSLGPSRQFVARRLIDGDYEAGLRLALVEPYEFDSASQKREKQILAAHWGNWQEAKAKLPPDNARVIVTYLADHPSDFRGAFARIRADWKILYLSAYQSYLWNRILAGWIEVHSRPDQLLYIDLRLGRYPMCRGLDDKQRGVLHAQRLPLPSARLKLNADDPWKELIDSTLRAEGLELKEMKLKHFREPFFSKGDRAAFFLPENLDYQAEPDELNAGKRKLIMRFELPRGCYATMLVKRIARQKPGFSEKPGF